ncbi:M20 family metallopeptidase [Paenibacillus paeoniae]|uniref:Probable succinyl-diaminopimelate desuccinylase n=1 Tax=Paenibacillus paeoniae TaxID=2292705 RepID=A0A371PIJ9_9BACL|nr:M20 family metallopeptidase [Paenibacillus paeoniae]REK76060.1 M20 family peptidase [Paenibacillus paeoniae]
MKNRIDATRTTNILRELVQIPSVNPSFEGGVPELEVADYVERFFHRLGLTVERREVKTDRPNIIGMLPGERSHSPGLLLEAHMDTVQTINMTIDPFAAVIEDGKLYGRGACDTKASLAAMLAAIEWCVENDKVPHIPVYIAATVDEEVHYQGVLDLLQIKERFSGAIVGEPTGLHAVIAHKGVVRCEIETVGIAAHSSRPSEGVSAIDAMVQVITHIREVVTPRLLAQPHPLVGAASLSVTEIAGGIAPNTIPDRCRIKIDRRTIPGEDSEQVWRELCDELNKLELGDDRASVIVHPPFVLDYTLDTSADSDIVQQLTKAACKRIGEVHTLGVPYGTDASKLAMVGIPSVVFGPGSIDQAHTEDEWVDLEQVALAADILIDVILSYGA